MRTLLLLLVMFSSAFSGQMWADDLTVLRMSNSQRSQLFNYLDSNGCTCGCGMKIGQCLHDDLTCPVSPKLANAAIQQLLSRGNANQTAESKVSSGNDSSQSTYINNSQNGSVVSGSINGRNCTYVSAGGMTFRDCD
ncbi:hypothetical protein A9Q81_05745 [Gammaproteobacteria bacterium 42_54_T18]|nr:hypothetical protein A9Q81_05745 [Gammaproteobacteria bacterium 42_54_T18]